MKVLVLGQGGREHALVRALKKSASVTEVHAAPGSAGMAWDAQCHGIDPTNTQRLLQLISQYQIDLVIVGPEAYLAAGVADNLRAAGVNVFGPNATGAQLESSKIFAKQFMEAARVPTSHYSIVHDVEETMKAAVEFTPPYVLKADGLAAGKGVVIAQNLVELEQAAKEFFVERKLGHAADRALLEQFQSGWEMSYLILTNGESYQALPLAQDHKRLLDGDRGPNTGGMGVVAPLKIDFSLENQIRESVLEPSVRHLGGMGLLYRGVLYCGLMVTPEGPRVIEYNVRFGDPECQVIMPLLDGDWGLVLSEVARGNMPDLKWRPMSAACIVMAAPGYPDSPRKGVAIEGEITSSSDSSYFLHAGTQFQNGHWSTNGGRVLNSMGLGRNLSEALNHAYQQARKVSWSGLQMRSDIGAKIPQ